MRSSFRANGASRRKGGKTPRAGNRSTASWRGWLLATLALASSVAALDVPAPEGRVTDLADLIEEDRRLRLETMLERAEKNSGIQLFVLTLPTLGGESLEEFAVAVARTWGVGHEGDDDGLLLLVVRDDHLLRLEVGYGLEARLTDLEAARLLEESVVPLLRGGAPGQAIESGVVAVLGRLDALPEESASSAGAIGPLGGALFAAGGGALLVFVTLRVLCAPGVAPWFVFTFFLLPLYAFFSAFAAPPDRGRVAGVVLATVAVLFLLLRVLVRHTSAGRRWARASRLGRVLGADREVEPRATDGTWSEASSRAGSGAHSSVSGGGGDFGGGGASRRW